jgi:hypothetical protein
MIRIGLSIVVSRG